MTVEYVCVWCEVRIQIVLAKQMIHRAGSDEIHKVYQYRLVTLPHAENRHMGFSHCTGNGLTFSSIPCIREMADIEWLF